MFSKSFAFAVVAMACMLANVCADTATSPVPRSGRGIKEQQVDSMDGPDFEEDDRDASNPSVDVERARGGRVPNHKSGESDKNYEEVTLHTKRFNKENKWSRRNRGHGRRCDRDCDCDRDDCDCCNDDCDDFGSGYYGGFYPGFGFGGGVVGGYGLDAYGLGLGGYGLDAYGLGLGNAGMYGAYPYGY